MSPIKDTQNGHGLGLDLQTLQEVDPAIRSLVEESIAARKNAYCPYSSFAVGAALRCKDGTVIRGANIENVSSGLTICAERTAVVKAVSEGHKDFEAIAVCAVLDNEAVSPCGACRQFMAEFNPNLPIYLHNSTTDTVVLTTLAYLLPMSLVTLQGKLDKTRGQLIEGAPQPE